MDIFKALFFYFACAKALHGIHCECYQCLRLVRGWVSAISFQLSILQGVREKKVILTLSFGFEQVTFLYFHESIFTLIAWQDNGKYLFGKIRKAQFEIHGTHLQTQWPLDLMSVAQLCFTWDVTSGV